MRAAVCHFKAVVPDKKCVTFNMFKLFPNNKNDPHDFDHDMVVSVGWTVLSRNVTADLLGFSSAEQECEVLSECRFSFQLSEATPESIDLTSGERCWIRIQRQTPLV